MSEPRTVLVDCEKMRYSNTGLYTYCHNLGQALIQHADPAQEHLTFFVPPNNPAPFGNHVEYKVIRKWHKLLIPSRGVDVWHCNYHESNYLPASRRTRRLITIHDLNFLIDDKERKDAHLKKVQRVVDRIDSVVCTSEYTARAVETHLNLRGKKTEVVYDGCHVAEFPGYDSPAYRPSAPFLFTIGIFFPKKNFHVLPSLLRGNSMELVIAGKRLPEYEAVVRAEAARMGVEDRIRLVDSVTEQDKYWYYKNCEAFLFPSLAEGFGLPVVEAMYFGKPLFLSSETCLPEVGGDLAFYFSDFDPDHMSSVFASGMKKYDDDLKKKLIHRAHDFSWERTARSYIRIYRSL